MSIILCRLKAIQNPYRHESRRSQSIRRFGPVCKRHGSSWFEYSETFGEDLKFPLSYEVMKKEAGKDAIELSVRERHGGRVCSNELNFSPVVFYFRCSQI